MNNSQHLGSETIACIVLNWNGGSDTVRCIRSLCDSRNVLLDILVIDNGSTDCSPRMLGDLFPQVTILKQRANIGVARGFNLGIDWALAKGYAFVFLLNNDAAVDKDCLAALKQTLDAGERAAIVSPRIVDGTRPGVMWFDGGERNAWGDPVHRGMSSPINREVGSRPQYFATGCAMLIRANAIGEVGRFDERFFAFSEDVEFCVRARRQGWQTIHNSHATATHYPSSATKKNKGKWFRDYYVTRNKLLLLSGELKGVEWLVFVLYFSLKYVVAPCLFFLMTGQFRRARAIVTGVLDFVKGAFGERYS